MYKLRVYIYLSRVPKLWRHKSYGFKNLVKLECWQTNFKITLGTCVFKKSCSTSNLAGVGALFDKFYGFFCSKSRACQLASLPRQTKPSWLKLSWAKWTYQVKHCISLHSKANPASNANQASKAKQSKQAKHRKANKSKTSNQTNQSKPKYKEKQRPSQLKPNLGKQVEHQKLNLEFLVFNRASLASQAITQSSKRASEQTSKQATN